MKFINKVFTGGVCAQTIKEHTEINVVNRENYVTMTSYIDTVPVLILTLVNLVPLTPISGQVA